MKTVIYDKLVRDKIPELITAGGSACQTRVLNREEYLEKLEEKLAEELAEYRESHDPEELADLLEVIYACSEAQGCSREALEAIRQAKAQKRGAFHDRILLQSVTQP